MEPEAELPGLGFQPAEIHELETIEELRALANPLRVQILDSLIEAPRTVKEIGDILEDSSTKLYYHVGELEKANLIRLIHTEVQSGIQLKYYRAVATYYFVPSSTLHKLGTQGGRGSEHEFLSTLIEIGAHQLRRSIVDGTVDSHDEAFMVSRRVRRMTPEQASWFRDRLAEIDRDFSKLGDEAGGVTVEFVVAMFPKEEANASSISRLVSGTD